jgi:RND family efflux transporter MFP subunit
MKRPHAHTQRRERHRRLVLATVLPALLVLIGACAGDAGPADLETTGAPIVTEIASVDLTTVPRVIQATGTLEAIKRVSPGTKIMGRIESVPVKVGDRVAAGQLLAQLESRDLDAAVTQAAAALTMAEANLENARAQYKRMRELFGRGSVTEKNLEDATAGFRVNEAAVDQARANLQAAEVTLGYARITSPVGGWVIEKHIEAGDMASPGRALFVIEDLSRVRVNVAVPEADVVGLSPGDPAQAAIEALDLTLPATIETVVPAGDPRSRTFSVRLLLDNGEGTLKSGMFARVSFARGERQALLVPASAVFRRGQLDGLFVVEEGIARLRWITVGRGITLEDGSSQVEVLSGLGAGERYVVSPPDTLADGSRIAS